MKKSIFGIIIVMLLTFLYFFIKDNPHNDYIVKIKNIFNKSEIVGIANPASTYCIENGGTIEIIDKSEGSIGICNFSNGNSCEERAFFRGECNPEEETNENKDTTQKDQIMCTMQYAPVCAKIDTECLIEPCEIIEQTFGNLCEMGKNSKATFFHEGECEAKNTDCPLYSKPSPDFCKDGTIEDGGIDENDCQLPPKCL